ncbi:hypothetical protein [Streptomyces sp. NPDC087300]|uniref:Rv1733c family protein n=1 Tax=Streptomyces sp. NPDC087300 TaxID=3365780 RepID=UPI00382D0B1E
MSAPTQQHPRAVAWRWRRNTLRRHSDVVEAWTVLLLGVAMLIVAPLAGAFAGSFTYGTAHARAERQRAEGHVVRATLIEDAPAATSAESRIRHAVRVRWTGRDGSTHTAVAKVAAGTTSGSRIDVWLDDQGRVTTAPMADDVQWGTAIGVGGATAFAVWVLAGGAWCTVRVVSHRHRMAEWEQAWARTGPKWTGSQT